MPNMKRITLKDPVTGDILIPTGTGLGYELTPSAPVPPYEVSRDAATLEGHPASYFAVAGEGPDMSNYYTKAEVDAMIRDVGWFLGNIITWDNKKWLVCHKDYDNNRVYLIAKDVISTTTFGNNNIYAGSTLASVAASYQSNNMSAAALAQCVDVTVNGVTAKVFVPSYEQMNGESGGFSWFNSNTNRIAEYNKSVYPYWTSSVGSSSYIWSVITDGNLNNGGPPSSAYGFRPCVCVQL